MKKKFDTPDGMHGEDVLVYEKFKEFTKNWHMDPKTDEASFNIKTASLGARYDFVSYLMKCLRCHLMWGSMPKGGGSPGYIERAFQKKGPAQCKQLCGILAKMVAFLGMPSVYVNFKGPKTSHWGLDVELTEGNWAFFDPTFLLCMKDTKPLNSDDISKRPDDLEKWHKYFNQVAHSFQESHQPPSQFKQPKIYTAAWKRKIRVHGEKKIIKKAHARADAYIKSVQ